MTSQLNFQILRQNVMGDTQTIIHKILYGQDFMVAPYIQIASEKMKQPVVAINEYADLMRAAELPFKGSFRISLAHGILDRSGLRICSARAICCESREFLLAKIN